MFNIAYSEGGCKKFFVSPFFIESNFHKLNTDLSKAITTDTIGQQSVNYATSAGSAAKLTSNAGNAEQPVYFTDGKPRACNLNPLYYNRSNGALSTKVDGTEYAVPFSGGSNYKVTGLEISRSLSNGKRVLLVTWYADGSTYHNTITCDQD
ncbi:MAG: hypothetical protein HFI42_16645 [Lachnospiraceae bacterium]|nr:hypothetical protein [Lachnospiraceae bacterium]